MQANNFEEVLERIVAADPRYNRDAYYFVREALDFTQKQMAKSKSGGPRRVSKQQTAGVGEPSHVTGQQLLGGIRDLALQQFGPMAFMVFDEWGLHRCEDFGEIVFIMVENSFLAKNESDSREDFKGGYDFVETFRVPFLPPSRQPREASAASPGGGSPSSPPPAQA